MKTVLGMVMVLLGKKEDWNEIKKQLGNVNAFIESLMNFDKDNITDKQLKKLAAYCQDPAM
jgi:dynein heavy chain